MEKQVKVLVLRAAGTNCDEETAYAFKAFGAKVDKIHINRLLNKEVALKDYHIFALPGGFTYGDDIESGRILANELKLYLKDDINQFIKDGKLIIGICNGFQILVKAGILPGTNDFKETATLVNNDSGKFEDRWVYLKTENDSVWTQGLKKIVFFPVAHAEGKFVPQDDSVLNAIKDNNQVAFRYVTKDGKAPSYPHNPNGSIEHIAGITDVTGRVLGLMPHPERHFLFIHHPSWTRFAEKTQFGDGAKIFENGINYIKNKLL